jgi:hypothetical protein
LFIISFFFKIINYLILLLSKLLKQVWWPKVCQDRRGYDKPRQEFLLLDGKKAKDTYCPGKKYLDLNLAMPFLLLLIKQL